jgi:hypothetical protein
MPEYGKEKGKGRKSLPFPSRDKMIKSPPEMKAVL